MWKRASIFVTLFLGILGGGAEAMAAQQDPSSELMIVWYEGPADAGRVDLLVTNKGRVKAAYAHHPMVKSSTPPWERDVDLGRESVTALFRALKAGEVKQARAPALILVPGQDVVVQSLWAAYGKSPPFVNASFLQAPPAFKAVCDELWKIYDLVAPKK